MKCKKCWPETEMIHKIRPIRKPVKPGSYVFKEHDQCPKCKNIVHSEKYKMRSEEYLRLVVNKNQKSLF